MHGPPDRPMRRTRLASADLPGAWEANARNWIAWARRAGHDSYWRFNRDAFLELVPPPGRRTLDLGCGEGRLSRDLKALGHHVVGVDISPTMLAAAREADPAIETHLADAAALPFADASFDCVVAFMSLQDIEHLGDAIGEAGRVLTPGGRLCLAIVHPLASAGRFDGEAPDSSFVIESSYLDASYYEDDIARGGLEITFTSAHRPLAGYAGALADAGFVIERLCELPIPEHALDSERAARWRRIPLFLYVRALKPPA